MKSIAKERLNADIYRTLSYALMTKINDPALLSATILKTELSADGSVCDVFVTANLTAFQQAAGFFRSELARVLNLRRTPRIVFILDEGQKNVDRVNALLAQIHQGEQK